MTDAATPPRISGLSYVRPLGEGGFASVYLYEQDLPRRMVAVKAMKAGSLDPDDRADFQNETDAMARLSNHPAIVSVYGAGVSAEGRPYLMMEYCPGSMREQTRGRPAQLAQVLDVGVRLAGALETAHRSGVLHRDIKPSNVMITTLGRPALADFGIAALRGRRSSEAAATAVTIPWTAPEVLEGMTRGSVASEVFSLAATLYTFAVGRSPFESSDPAKNTRAHLTRRIIGARYRPVPGAEGYGAFDTVMRTALAKHPQDRFSSMDAFADALQQLQRHYGFETTPFEMVRDVWPETKPQAVEPGTVRGPQITPVRTHSRADRRAGLHHTHGRTEDNDAPRSVHTLTPLAAGLLGAGVAIAGVAVVVAIAALVGWL